MKRFPFLDGIRGWGAVIVLLYHVFVDGFPLSRQSQTLLHQTFLFNGPFAVWVFFVVSGFSLSIAFVKNRDRMGLLKLAYGRYLRLAVPILFFSLLMLISLRSGAVPAVDARPDRFKGIFTTTPTLSSTTRFALFDVFFDYSEARTLIPPLWTMPIELMGSMVVFSLCAVFGTTSWRRAVYLLALAAAFARPELTYYGAFFAGMLFAELYASRTITESIWRPFLIFLVAAVLAAWLPGGSARLYLLVAILMFYGMTCCRPLKAFLECGASRFLGRISFTLYLFHAIVMWTLSLQATIFLRDHGFASASSRFIVNVTTVAAALLGSRVLVFVDEFAVVVSRKFSTSLMSATYRLRTMRALPARVDGVS